MPEVQSQYRGSMEIKRLNPLKELYTAGQSPWYDNIERRLFKSGEFDRLINDYGMKGVTSNPTIFDKAISNSADYDEQIKALAKAKKNSNEVYDELTIQDIGTAADRLIGVFNDTAGIDGYVSIEVPPEYAYDTDKTIAYAKKLFTRLNRKNILIKVPGTSQGVPAIRTLISSGINVNVTLLFSLSDYEAIANAYIDGLKDRLNKGLALNSVTSVASVFVSRIDTRVDKMAEARAPGLCGKAAVANSKIIYQRFKKLFLDGEFKDLAKTGARIQRPLWASTGTKNPAYRDVKYVEELIGPYTINTMPHQTVMAFYDHGVVKSVIEDGADQAPAVLKQLKDIGIDVDSICKELQTEGVKSFTDSFTSLIKSIEKKMASL